MSATANQKQINVRGTLPAKIKLVVICPNWGFPELNSNIEPTPAIAKTQDNNSKNPLFGVIIMQVISNK